MKDARAKRPHSSQGANPAFAVWTLAIGSLLLVLIIVLRQRPNNQTPASAAPTSSMPVVEPRPHGSPRPSGHHRYRDLATEAEPPKTAEQIVSEKVIQFGR